MGPTGMVLKSQTMLTHVPEDEEFGLGGFGCSREAEGSRLKRRGEELTLEELEDRLLLQKVRIRQLRADYELRSLAYSWKRGFEDFGRP